MPVARVSPAAMGAGIGNAVQDLGNTAVQAIDAFADRNTTTEGKEADVLLSKRIRDRMFGTADVPGYYSLEGNDAITGRQQVNDDINQYKQEAIEGLSPRAKLKFQDTADRRTNAALDGAGKHVFDHQRKLETSTSIAREENSYQDAAAAAGTPDALVYVNTAGEEAAARARRAGASSDEIINDRQKAKTKAHIAIIDAFLDGRPGGAAKAKAHYDANLSDIDGNVRAALQDKIRVGAVVQESQAMTDGIMGDYLSNGKDEKAAMKSARAIKDPAIRDATVGRVERRIAEDVRFERMAQQGLRLSAIKKIQDGQENLVTVEETEAMLASTGGVTFLQTGGERSRAIKAGRYNQPDVDYENTIAKMDEQELIAFDLTSGEAVAKLGTQHGKWLNEQTKARKAVEAGENQGRTPAQIRADGAKDVGKGGASEFAARFDMDIEAALQGKPKGTVLPSTEVQKISDRLTLQMRREVRAGLRGGMVTGLGQAFGIDEVSKMFKIAPRDAPAFVVEDTEENHDNLARMFGFPANIASDVIAKTEEVYGSATLENLQKATDAMKAARDAQ